MTTANEARTPAPEDLASIRKAPENLHWPWKVAL
jgi:hypothetical protein